MPIVVGERAKKKQSGIMLGEDRYDLMLEMLDCWDDIEDSERSRRNKHVKSLGRGGSLLCFPGSPRTRAQASKEREN